MLSQTSVIHNKYYLQNTAGIKNELKQIDFVYFKRKDTVNERSSADEQQQYSYK